MENKVTRTQPFFLNHSIDNTEIYCRENFTDEEKAIGEMVKEFALDRIKPNREELNGYDKELSLEIMREMGELGLTAVDIPEAYGGTPLDKISTSIIAEEIAHSDCSSFGTTFSTHINIGSLPIIWFGTSEQKEKYLPKLATAEWIGAFGLTEPTAGSDAMSGKTNAVLSDDGKHYILNGEKVFITNGGWADVFTIFCQIDGDKFSALILEKGMEGFVIGAEEKKLGMKGSTTVQLFFNDVKVPVKNLLYEVGRGADVAFNVLNMGRVKFGPGMLGSCKRAISHAVTYVNERKQFGQLISSFGAIQKKIADMAIATYALDSMSYRILGTIKDEVDSLDKGDASYYTQIGLMLKHYQVEMSMAKVSGSDTLADVVDDGLQVFGGYGFIEEYPMAEMFRDARIQKIWEGTNEINRQIIAKSVLVQALKGLLSMKGEPSDHEDPLCQSIESAKSLVGLIIGQAIETFGKTVMGKQQLQEALADMMTDIFMVESALIRIRQTSNNESGAKIGAVLVSEKMGGLIQSAKQCLLHIYNGSLPENIMNEFDRFAKSIEIDQDTFALKKEIALEVITRGDYPY